MRTTETLQRECAPPITSVRWQFCRLALGAPAIACSPMAANTTIVAALLAGLGSFLSPCVLPLVPPYLVYLAGASLERLADAEPERRVRRETIAAALLFVAGFSTVFVALGAGASAIGSLMRVYSYAPATAAGGGVL